MNDRPPSSVLDYEPPPATQGDDPYVLGDGAVVDPPTSLGKAFLQIGPGLILAGAIVGTGELIATTNLGAKVGFALLWLVIVSCFIKVFVQVELGRYALSSGETTMTSFRRLPGPGAIIGWWWVIMMLITQLQMGAMVGGVGEAFNIALPGVSPAIAKGLGWSWLASRPEIPGAVVVTLLTIVLLSRGSYAIIEKGTTMMVVAFTIVTIVCVALLGATQHPIRWENVRQGMSFRLPPVEGAVAAALAMFGITGVGAAELMAYPYWCIEKGYGRKTGKRDASAAWLERARGWMRVMRLDAWVSFGVYTVATIAFYVLGAAVLHTGGGQGLPTKIGPMLDKLTRMYEPVMGPAGAKWFLVIGVIAVLYSTLFAATGANSRALVDFMKVNKLVTADRLEDRRRLVRWCCVIFPIADFILFVRLGNPLSMVIIGGIAQALTLPMLAGAAVYLRYRRTDRRLTPGIAWDLFLWLSFAGLILAASVGVWDQVKKMM
jgi:Mn2+/Fe2+ NRAMP family transporter